MMPFCAILKSSAKQLNIFRTKCAADIRTLPGERWPDCGISLPMPISALMMKFYGTLYKTKSPPLWII